MFERFGAFLHSPRSRPLIILVVCVVAAILFFAFHHDTPKPKTYGTLAVGGVASPSTKSSSSQQNSTALFNSSVHGILAVDSGNLELLSTANGKVIASKVLPSSTNTMTDNGNGKQFTFSTQNAGTAGFNFNSTYQYIPVEFKQAADGSEDVGYYNLANGHVTDISNNKTGTSFGAEPTVDTAPVFDPTNPNILYFCRNDCGGSNNGAVANYSYNITTGTKQQASYAGPPACQSPYVSYGDDDCELPGRGPSAGMGLTTDDGNSGALAIDSPAGASINSDTSLVDIVYVSGGQNNDIGCTPIQWLDSSHILCNEDQDNSGDFNDEIVDLGAMTQSTNDYGNTQYTVPQPTSLLPNNDRTNSSPITSPDSKKMAFVSTLENATGLYTVAITGGQPTEIGPIDSSTKLVEWR